MKKQNKTKQNGTIDKNFKYSANITWDLYLFELLPAVGPSPKMSFVKADSHSHEQIASVVEGGPVEMKLGGEGTLTLKLKLFWSERTELKK